MPVSGDSQQPTALGGKGKRVALEAFQTTRWSVVLKAGEHAGDDQRAALATLCQDYWFPIYAFVRRRGANHHDAQDQTQGFFADLLEREDLGAADPGKGRFRSYLLASAKNFVAKEHRRSVAQKRGGGIAMLSTDVDECAFRFEAEASDGATPEVLYHRAWANTLLGKVMLQLEAEFQESGKGALFDALKDKLAEPKGASSNSEEAARLGMSTGAVAVTLHRMRGRYRELLRRAVRDTLSGEETEMDVDAEIQQLLAAVS